MDAGDEDECDLEYDFIRKPKCFHSTPRVSSNLKDDNQHGNKRELSLTPCNSISSVENAPVEYINPFTPEGKIFANKVKAQKKFRKLCISDPPTLKDDESNCFENLSQSDIDSGLDLPKRPRLREMNVSRFYEEFIILEEIGRGDHGCVYKCLNRMNGCIYAIKKTIRPLTTDFQERSVRNEIYAHGVLIHDNVLCNFSCWIEEGHAFIQNEYCNLGSLEEYIKTNVMTENMLRKLLWQMTHALNHIHSKGLAHMDIKPDNIFLKSDISGDDDSGFGEKTDSIIFKLGDFGHITTLDEESDIEEGDCRYLPREIIEGKLSRLDKSDIFSLGLTVYEAAGGGPLPKNGEEWHEIRNGKLKSLENISLEFYNILKAMVHPQSEERPSASDLIKMLKLSQSMTSCAEDDLNYMHQYYHSNARLEHRVETTGHIIRELYKTHRQLQSEMNSFGYSRELLSISGKRNGSVNKSRIVGKKAKRSNSTMF